MGPPGDATETVADLLAARKHEPEENALSHSAHYSVRRFNSS
jgi:hypothetical protein